MPDDAKVYLDDLIKKTIGNKKMDISFVKTMTAKQDSVDEKPLLLIHMMQIIIL